jgi:hypothetical protein
MTRPCFLGSGIATHLGTGVAENLSGLHEPPRPPQRLERRVDDRVCRIPYKPLSGFPLESEGTRLNDVVDTVITALAGGRHLPPDRLEHFREAAGIGEVFAYRHGLPWYDSQTGYGIHRFLTTEVARTLVRIDGDPSGRTTLLVIDAAPPGATDPTRRLRDRRNGG